MSLDGQRSLLYAIWLCIFGNLGFDFRSHVPDCPAKEENKDVSCSPPPPANLNFFFLPYCFLGDFKSLSFFVLLFWLELLFCWFSLFLCFCVFFFFSSPPPFQLASVIRVVCASPPRPAPTPTMTEECNSGSSVPGVFHRDGASLCYDIAHRYRELLKSGLKFAFNADDRLRIASGLGFLIRTCLSSCLP